MWGMGCSLAIQNINGVGHGILYSHQLYRKGVEAVANIKSLSIGQRDRRGTLKQLRNEEIGCRTRSVDDIMIL